MSNPIKRIELKEISPTSGEFIQPKEIPLLRKEPSTEIDNQKQRDEFIGMGFAVVAIFFRAFATFYTKVIQRAYPTKFHTVPFLWLRSFTIMLFALIHTKISGIPIIKLKDIPFKLWFFYRTNMNFFGMSFMTMSLWYLRASTAQIIFSLSPIIVLILSRLILKEPYYFRYTIGTVLCLIGSSIIVFTENKVDSNKQNDHNNSTSTTNENTHSSWDTTRGLIFISIAMFSVTFVDIANKILASNKVPINTQMMYVGLSTMMYSTIFIIFFGGVELDPGYLVMCLFHGVFFYLSNICYNKALQLSPISKLIIINYTQIVFVFLLAFLFLHEPIFFTDLLGTAFIFSYMIYNATHPIKDKKETSTSNNALSAK